MLKLVKSLKMLDGYFLTSEYLSVEIVTSKKEVIECELKSNRHHQS